MLGCATREALEAARDRLRATEDHWPADACASIVDQWPSIESALTIAEAARTFVTARRRFYNDVPTQRADDVAWATLAAAVDAEREGRP